jgi:serine/threonine protein kinase
MVHELQPADPRQIGPYRLRGRLGTGGMGQVFLGLSAGGRPVAVKVVRADLASDPEFRERFRREVAVARRVSGLFTAPVIDADLDGPVPWLATAYVPGPSLADAVAAHGPLPAASVLALGAGLAEGLKAIHAAGVVHRDLKPANVLLAQDGPRVIDFGISRALEATSSLTRTGLVVGSPGFMSPEQAEGREVGPPSDIFSLGAILAFAATGEGPFGGGSTPALIYRVVYSPASLDNVPAEVRPLIERCLAKDPRQRPTAGQLLAAADSAQPGSGWLPEPVTSTFTQLPDLATSPRAGTPTRTAAAHPSLPPPPPHPSLPTQPAPPPGARAWWSGETTARRRLWQRPLAVAAIVTGLLGASAAAGFALTAKSHTEHAPQQQASSVPATPTASSSPSPSSTPATSRPVTTPSTSAPAYVPAPANTAAPYTSPATTTSPSTSPTETASPTATPSTSSSTTWSPTPSTSQPAASGSS